MCRHAYFSTGPPLARSFVSQTVEEKKCFQINLSGPSYLSALDIAKTLKHAHLGHRNTLQAISQVLCGTALRSGPKLLSFLWPTKNSENGPLSFITRGSELSSVAQVKRHLVTYHHVLSKLNLEEQEYHFESSIQLSSCLELALLKLINSS